MIIITKVILEGLYIIENVYIYIIYATLIESL